MRHGSARCVDLGEVDVDSFVACGGCVAVCCVAGDVGAVLAAALLDADAVSVLSCSCLGEILTVVPESCGGSLGVLRVAVRAEWDLARPPTGAELAAIGAEPGSVLAGPPLLGWVA